jgi:hypothetical protein
LISCCFASGRRRRRSCLDTAHNSNSDDANSTVSGSNGAVGTTDTDISHAPITDGASNTNSTTSSYAPSTNSISNINNSNSGISHVRPSSSRGIVQATTLPLQNSTSLAELTTNSNTSSSSAYDNANDDVDDDALSIALAQSRIR